MGILDRDLQEVDLRKQEAYRLMATYNQETGEQFFDWVKVAQEGNVMLHESLRRLRAKQLPEAQRGNLKDLLPPLVVAVNKVFYYIFAIEMLCDVICELLIIN